MTGRRQGRRGTGLNGLACSGGRRRRGEGWARAPACGIEREALTPLWRREQGKEMGIGRERGEGLGLDRHVAGPVLVG